MQWLIGSIALVLSILLAFQFAQSRRALMATLAVLLILATAAALFLLVENRRSVEQTERTLRLILPEHVSLTDASFDSQYGNWRLRGTLINHSDHRVGGLTVLVTVRDCPPPDECKTIGQQEASTVALDIAPRRSQQINLIVRFPDMLTPRAMQWSYKITEVRAARG